MPIRACADCGEPFIRRGKSARKYCDKCRGPRAKSRRYRSGNLVGDEVDLVCADCGEPWTHIVARGVLPRYCPVCAAPEARGRRLRKSDRSPRPCEDCGETFTPHRSGLRYCPSCSTQAARTRRTRAKHRTAVGHTVCGCGRDYLTVPLEEAHDPCPRPVEAGSAAHVALLVQRGMPQKEAETAVAEHLRSLLYSENAGGS